MTLTLLLFSLLVIILFFLSHKISTSIYNSIFIVTNSRKFAIGVLIILLLPGTIIHEISHFLVATILRVPTGELTVMPTIEKSGPASNASRSDAGWEVKAGKLFLGETDPFRLSLIGLAPIFIGLFLIYLFGKSFIPSTNELITVLSSPLLLSVICYLLFIVSLTMFSSKKDLRGVIIAGPIILLLIVALYSAGIRVFLENNILQKIERFSADLNYYLVITAILDFLVFLILNVSLSFWQKLLKRQAN